MCLCRKSKVEPMGRGQINAVDPSAILLENILTIMSDFTFGKKDAMHIVGGEKKLTDLIAAGKIEATKPTEAQNGKWFCNAAQVLRHCRNTRKKKR